MAAMRQNKKSAGTVDPAARQKKKKLVRGIILLTVLIFLIATMSLLSNLSMFYNQFSSPKI